MNRISKYIEPEGTLEEMDSLLNQIQKTIQNIKREVNRNPVKEYTKSLEWLKKWSEL